MTEFFAFLSVLALLITEGSLLSRRLLKTGWPLNIALALPLAAFLNVIITFIWTVFGIPLTPLSLLGPHLIFTFLLTAGIRIPPKPEMNNPVPKNSLNPFHKILISVSVLTLSIVAVFSFVHAVMLPTFQYDSATNWTMRSQISFVDQHIAFDPTENRGMAKPQYPFLFHALQITANQGQTRWNDTAANLILLLLSLGSFAAVGLIFSRLRGWFMALIIIALTVGIPLLSLHLAQGYADINLTQFLLLSLACLAVWLESEASGRWLLMSAVFAASAVWTKSEGIIFGLLPWLLIVAFLYKKRTAVRREALVAAASAIALSLPWQLFAWIKGLSLTPHSSDMMIGFHPEGVGEAFLGLYSRGSFGIIWYVIPVFIGLILLLRFKKDSRIESRQLPLLVWSGIIFLSVLFIYLWTPNVRFLLNAESYYRQMMVPAAMLMLSSGFCFRQDKAGVS